MSMPNLTNDQVIDFVKQLPPAQQRTALFALAEGAASRRLQAEQQLRKLSADRGLDWDKLTEDEREEFIDGLMHEDRSCRP